MAKKILNVVTVGYRATLEEQDDPVLWLTHVLKASGGDVSVLLSGSAVNYLVRAQDAGGLSFGGRAQTQPPRLAHDMAKLVAKGVPVHYVAEDLRERGIAAEELVPGAIAVTGAEVPVLFEQHAQVFTW